jgi:hypothetical protein
VNELALLKVAVSALLVLVPPGHVPTPVLQLFSDADVIQLPSVGEASHVALAACAGAAERTRSAREITARTVAP